MSTGYEDTEVCHTIHISLTQQLQPVVFTLTGLGSGFIKYTKSLTCFRNRITQGRLVFFYTRIKPKKKKGEKHNTGLTFSATSRGQREAGWPQKVRPHRGQLTIPVAGDAGWQCSFLYRHASNEAVTGVTAPQGMADSAAAWNI